MRLDFFWSFRNVKLSVLCRLESETDTQMDIFISQPTFMHLANSDAAIITFEILVMQDLDKLEKSTKSP